MSGARQVEMQCDYLALLLSSANFDHILVRAQYGKDNKQLAEFVPA